jgi:hypothetical protein
VVVLAFWFLRLGFRMGIIRLGLFLGGGITTTASYTIVLFGGFSLVPHGSVAESRCGFLVLQLQAFVFFFALLACLCTERRLRLDFGCWEDSGWT